jgi:outer membrane protein assembly factor BamB
VNLFLINQFTLFTMRFSKVKTLLSEIVSLSSKVSLFKRRLWSFFAFAIFMGLSSSVWANTAPTALSMSFTVVSGSPSTVTLYARDVDVGQTLSFIIVTPPTKGTLTAGTQQLSGSYITKIFTYKSNAGYVGSDTFTWKVNDGTVDSTIATATLTVKANALPVVDKKTVTAFTAARSKVTCTFSDSDSSQAGKHTFSTAALPLKGKLEYFDAASGTYKLIVANTQYSTPTWYYTSNAGYVGSDSFSFRVFDGIGTGSGLCSILVKANLYGKDWPMYRYDHNRGAKSPLTLPSTLTLQWKRSLPALKPAWTGAPGSSSTYTYSVTYDKGYEPVVMGSIMYVASNRNDSVTAYDTDTGAEKWRFYAEGPVRFAPIAVNGKVYFSSDDGCLYCLDGITGSQLWKFEGKPSDRMIFGNNRLISVWPSRGGPVYYGGTIYFGTGAWPMDGTFMFAVNASTGQQVWKNDSIGALNIQQPHAGAACTGIMPNGHLVMGTDGRVIVPTGRADPAFFDRTTGAMSGYGSHGSKENPGSSFVTMSGACVDGFPVSIESGTSTYATGPGITESVHTLIAADDKLFVVGKSGTIYCFGGNAVANPSAYPIDNIPLPTVSDSWSTAVSNMIAQQGGVKEGCCLVWGIGTGRLVEELAKQTNFLIDVVDPDAAKVAALRRKLDKANLYGSSLDASGYYKPRVTIHVGDPSSIEFPPYAARLICSEDINVAGFNSGITFVKKVFTSLRPYGGTCWLPISSIQESSFNSSVQASGLDQAVVSRNGQFSLLTRSGRLTGSTDFIRPSTGAAILSPDMVVKAPLAPLWYSDEYRWGSTLNQTSYPSGPDIVNGLMITPAGKTYDLYTGLLIAGTQPFSGTKTLIRDSRADAFSYGIRKNPFNGRDELRTIDKMYGCFEGRSYGKLLSYRSGSAAFYDMQTETGSIHIGGMRPGCEAFGTIPANGVLAVGGPPVGHHCMCPYPVRTSMVMVHRPDGQRYAPWGDELTSRTIAEDPIRKLGINFGAPNDARAPDGTLWLNRPFADTHASPRMRVTSTDTWSRYMHDQSWVNAPGWEWVARCGVTGFTNMKVDLAPAVVALPSSAPVIDGQLTDACWNGQAPVNLFNTGKVVYFRYDANNLYASFRYTAEDLHLITSLDGWSLFISDRAHQLDNAGEASNPIGKCLHFRLKKSGVKFDSLRLDGGGENVAWEGVWDGAVSVSTTEVIAEMSIPWSTITGVGLDKASMLVNIQAPGGTQLRGLPSSGQTREWLEESGKMRVCNRYVPFYFDTAKGELGKTRNYTVRLFFVEPTATAAGQRVFDIKLQDSLKLSGFDIFQAAGGAKKLIIKEFKGIPVKEALSLNLVQTGSLTPAIAGIEMIEESGTTTPGDTTPPTVAMSAPAAGATVSGTVTVSATASDAVGVAGVQFKLDGADLGTEDTSSSYSISWNTASVSNGTYTLTAVARDAAGNTTTSASRTVTVSNSVTGDALPDTWQTQYFGSGFATNPQAQVDADPDGDGMTNADEYKAGTSPVDGSSLLNITDQVPVSATSFMIEWQSVPGKQYQVQTSTDLVSWTTVATVTASSGSTTSWTDTSAGAGKKFYRIRIP